MKKIKFEKKIKKLYSNICRGRFGTHDPKDTTIKTRLKYDGSRYIFAFPDDDGYTIGVNYGPYCSRMLSVEALSLSVLKISLMRLMRERRSQAMPIECVEIGGEEGFHLFDDLF